MRTKEPIDKVKILDIALENAAKCKTNFTSTEEAMYGLNLEEQILMLGLTYVILLTRSVPIPKEITANLMNTINTNCQRFAADMQRYRDYSKRQIDLIKPTNALRAEFTRQINSGHFDEALTIACKLIDIYEFGIAGSQINQDILNKAREKYDVQVD